MISLVGWPKLVKFFFFTTGCLAKLVKFFFCMADSDSDSVSSAAHVVKARKGADGNVAKLREQFEPSTSQALAIVPTRRSARVQAASQPQTTGKRARSPAVLGSRSPVEASPAPASSPATDPPALTLAALLARIEALEGDTQHLRTDLRQTKSELAASRSELAEAKDTLDTRLQEHTSHCIARETAVKDELQQLVSTEGSSLEHLSQRVRANNIVMHGVPDTAATSKPADLTRLVKGKLDAAAPRRLYSCTVSVHSGSQPHWQARQQQEGSPGGVLHPHG